MATKDNAPINEVTFRKKLNEFVFFITMGTSTQSTIFRCRGKSAFTDWLGGGSINHERFTVRDKGLDQCLTSVEPTNGIRKLFCVAD